MNCLLNLLVWRTGRVLPQTAYNDPLLTLIRFIESLTAKVYAEPPTIEKLSDLFQAFYVKASSHIATHIATLALRIDREPSLTQSTPKPVLGPRAKALPRQLSKDSIASTTTSVQQQMLTSTEVAERKKARKLLEYKRLALEEAVERRICEKVYIKIWRHKSTLDEIRDEKLRSKTAALALVGIGLKDLGIEISSPGTSTEDDVRERLAPAREELASMNVEKSPLGKLHRLTTAHKTIVETLSTIHPATSSADEILPTLIYTLITSPAEGINIISNLAFIERFRTASKLDGEAAYCMTNLEAAIVFLEDVDLASLREDELPSGPPKTPSRPTTPAQYVSHSTKSSDHLSFPGTTSPEGVDQIIPRPASTDVSSSESRPQLSSQRSAKTPISLHQRRLSNLLNPPAKAIGAANDAVRNTAEEGLKSISTTLDNSFQFFFGKLKEQNNSKAQPAIPQTLEEARKLVSQPLVPEDGNISETSSLAERDVEEPVRREDRLLGMIGGRSHAHPRERSVDSERSNASDRRAVSAPGNSINVAQTPPIPNPLDSVKSLGNSFNPLTHLGSAFRGFAKNATASTPPATEKGALASSSAISVNSQNLESPPRIDPPVQRFIEAKDVGDLSVRDISLLLSDYQRLAKIVYESKRE